MVGGRREGSGRRTAAGAARSAPLPSWLLAPCGRSSAPFPVPLRAAGCCAMPGRPEDGAAGGEQQSGTAAARGGGGKVTRGGRSGPQHGAAYLSLFWAAPPDAASPGPGRLRAPEARGCGNCGAAPRPPPLRSRWGCSSGARPPETPPRPRRERVSPPSHAVGNSQGSESSERAAACSPRVTPLRALRPLVAGHCRHCPRGTWCARGGVRSGGTLTISES